MEGVATSVCPSLDYFNTSKDLPKLAQNPAEIPTCGGISPRRRGESTMGAPLFHQGHQAHLQLPGTSLSHSSIQVLKQDRNS